MKINNVIISADFHMPSIKGKEFLGKISYLNSDGLAVFEYILNDDKRTIKGFETYEDAMAYTMMFYLGNKKRFR